MSGTPFKFYEGEGPMSRIPALKRTESQDWLIDGILPRGSIVWVSGAPQSFKTFIALDMAHALGTGRDWNGRAAQLSACLYVAAEGGDDVQVRMAGVEQARGEASMVAIHQARPRLDEETGKIEAMGALEGVRSFYDIDSSADPVSRFERLALRVLDDEEKQDLLDRWYNRRKDHPHPFFDFDSKPDLEDCDPPGYIIENNEMAARMLEKKHLSATEKAIMRAFRLSWGGRAEKFLMDVRGMDRRAAYEAEDKLQEVLFVDTYSQTALDDDKRAVSLYIKNLRDLIDERGGALSIVVLDHLTKSGDSYMGSGAKEGDVDVMFRVKRKGDGNSGTIDCLKMKSAPLPPAIKFTMKPHTIEGFTDAQGRPLKTLVPEEGAADDAGEIHPTEIILNILEEAGGKLERDDLRQQFIEVRLAGGAKRDTAIKAFNRAMERLHETLAIREDDAGRVAVNANH